MDVTLVIMAAGMGSRFGGLKQIEPMGPNGEIIADYSVYDAIRAGFNHIVFIIREENLEYFKKNITCNFDSKVDVRFAFQELNKVPEDVIVPSIRVKMLGTGHAILCAKDEIVGNFAIINSDDFYGYDTFKKLHDFLVNGTDDYISVSYEVSKTMSENGAVKRGVVFTDGRYIKETIESEISYVGNKIIAESLKDGRKFEIAPNQAVSMNSLGFKHEFLDLLESKFNTFIHGEITDKNEFLIPEVLSELLSENKIKGISVTSTSKWMGVTYREDVESFKREINKLIEDGEYPRNLWF